MPVVRKRNAWFERAHRLNISGNDAPGKTNAPTPADARYNYRSLLLN